MSASPSEPQIGVWLIGARGSVATTVVAGCAAVTAGLHPPTGMVTETPLFAGCGLPALSSLVFGGHDTVDCPLPKRAEALASGGVLRPACRRPSRPNWKPPTGRSAPAARSPATPGTPPSWWPASPPTSRTSFGDGA